jgi:hypothetical protein
MWDCYVQESVKHVIAVFMKKLISIFAINFPGSCIYFPDAYISNGIEEGGWNRSVPDNSYIYVTSWELLFVLTLHTAPANIVVSSHEALFIFRLARA